MDNNDILSDATTNKHLHQLALLSSEEEIKKEVLSLGTTEISDLLTLLQIQADESGQNTSYDKALSVLKSLEEAPKLQVAGQALSPLLFNHLLTGVTQGQTALQKRLPPLLVGMKPSVFIETLLHANEQQIHVLKQEASTEPLQHQLGILIQELEKTLETGQKNLELFYRQIQEQPLDNLDKEQFHQIDREAERLFTTTLVPKQLITKSLSIAWNTSRMDLISKLSSLKERYYKYSLHFAEPSETDSPNAMNVHEVIKAKLNSAFDKTVADDTAAIDALANFSIWYLQDYWEIGLLPNIKNMEELLNSENSRNSQRGDLFETAKSNLEKIGLVTLKDLKQAHIYSRKALKEYISQHMKCGDQPPHC